VHVSSGDNHGKPLRNIRIRSAAVEKEILALLRESYLCLYGGASREPKDVKLSLNLDIDPQQGWRLLNEGVLQEQIERCIREAGAKADCLQQGFVYCYHCETSQCCHAVPPRPHAVFQCYSSSGIPQWTDFAQLLVERNDERAYLLFQKQPPVLAHVILGRELKREQLHLFGKASKSYDVLGQVASGYFHDPMGNGDSDRFAITFQVVESRGCLGETRLDMNILGWISDRMSAREYLDEYAEEALRQSVITAEISLEELREKLHPTQGRPSSRTRSQLLGKVPGILKDLGTHLERSSRLSARRTRHAQRRSQEARPTAKAIDDALSASIERILLDERKDTIVVLGPRNRVHVFGKDGAHVTSLSIHKEAVGKRIKRRRWIPAPSHVLHAFQETLSSIGREAEENREFS